MQFKIDLKIFAFLLLFYFTGQIEIYFFIMLFAIIHELAHLLVGMFLGMKPNKLEIKSYGISISFNVDISDYNKKIQKGTFFNFKKIFVAIAGPFINLLLIGIISKMDLPLYLKMTMLYSNFLLMLFNLLPIYPLDGGRILKEILHIIFGRRKAEKLSNNISFITILILTFIASITIFYIKNVALFLIIIFLWYLYITQDLVYKRREKIYNLIEKTIEIG